MIYRAMVMGFNTVHPTYLKEEYSLNFVEAINELRSFRDADLIYEGAVNTGEDESQKRGIYGSIRTDHAYTGDFMLINKQHRKQRTQRVRSNLGEWVWPTVVLMFDESRRLRGLISLPDRGYAGVRDNFIKDLNFFLHPPLDNKPTSQNIVLI